MATLEQGRRKFLVCIKEKNLHFCCSRWISLERDLAYIRNQETRSSEQKGIWEKGGEAGEEATLCLESGAPGRQGTEGTGVRERLVSVHSGTLRP